ncbi:MAG: hypothetical protein ACKV22_13545 [Bryobacteraceae bacterium]
MPVNGVRLAWALLTLCQVGLAAPPFELSDAHRKAVNRQRRIAVQYDAADHRHVALPTGEWLKYVFAFVDEPGSQIDSILWDIGLGDWAVYPSKVLAPTRDTQIVKWRAAGFDWVDALVRACRERKIEVLWNHRFSEVDIAPEGGLEMKLMHPLKEKHPDWVIKSWWWQGLWNAAAPGLREYKVRQLRELVENYPLDGIRIDFARHVPCLPPGRQWEMRDHVTGFLRMTRSMLLDAERRTGRPLLLGVKVPRTLEGCRIDGFDIEAWARENLVDILTLGSRSIDVDIEAFRRVTAGTNMKLQPCLDDHHATDGYRYPPIEFFRGVFSNWWAQGADSVSTFNWGSAPAEWATRVGGFAGPASQQQAYHEVGSAQTMAFKDKLFAVERRGGYPWAEGFFGRNDTAPLPVVLANDGRPESFVIRVSDDASGPRFRDAALRLVLFRAGARDQLEVLLNDQRLEAPARDAGWKDPQIFSPKPQPNSGGTGDYRIDPGQQLLRLEYSLQAGQLRKGRNSVRIRVVEREPFRPGHDIQVEKVEISLRYAPQK